MPLLIAQMIFLCDFVGQGDGRALQSGTSHNLGQNFSTAFESYFSDPQGQLTALYQTSFGMSSRM